MRGGAPHEAERGLATAMDHLREPDKSEALVLLGEALQEQGRDAESIAFLEQVSSDAPLELRVRKNVLVLIAQRFLRPRTGEEHAGIIRQLIEEGQKASRANTRLRSLWLAALYYRDVNQPQVLSTIERLLAEENLDALSIDDKAEYALAKAVLLYHGKNREASLHALSDIISEMETTGLANFVFLTMILGVNTLHCSLGNYEQAIAAGLKGMTIARRMGDETRIVSLASNLALCHFRIGNYHDQLTWASIAAKQDVGRRDLVLRVQIAYIASMGHAILGRPEEALGELESIPEAEASAFAPWIRQGWYLRKADVLQIVGRRREALLSAQNASSGELTELLRDSNAGLFARWRAIRASGSLPEIPQALRDLEKLRQKERLLDKLDYVEVLNAKVWLASKCGTVEEKDRQEMWKLLREMPQGVSTQLLRLGLLDGPF
jgi:tetratricopeptide (TPR) repeat protein